ncbi:unnamed protein product, partial [Rotaria sordida]
TARLSYLSSQYGWQSIACDVTDRGRSLD